VGYFGIARRAAANEKKAHEPGGEGRKNRKGRRQGDVDSHQAGLVGVTRKLGSVAQFAGREVGSGLGEKVRRERFRQKKRRG